MERVTNINMNVQGMDTPAFREEGDVYANPTIVQELLSIRQTEKLSRKKGAGREENKGKCKPKKNNNNTR